MPDIIKPGNQNKAFLSERRQAAINYVPESPEREGGFDSRHILTILWRRKYTILLVTVLAVIPVAISTYIATPLYRSTLTLEIDPEQTKVLPYREVTDLIGGTSNYELYMKTQDQILRSQSLADRVASRLKQEQAPAEKEGTKTLPYPLEVQRLPNSQLVLLGYVSPDPRTAARTVNLFAEEYIKQHFEAKQKMREKAIDFLDRELSGLKKRIEVSEKEFVQYGHANNLEASQMSVVQQKLAFLSNQISGLETELITAKTRFDALREASLQKFPSRLLSANINGLEGKLLTLEQELSDMLTKFDENWPGVIRKRQEIALAKEQLVREKSDALEQARLEAEVEYRTTERRHQMLVSAQTEQEDVIRKMNEASIQFNIFKREVETSQQLYNGLMERLKQTSVTAGLEFGNIHVVEPGRPSRFVYSPRVVWNLGLGSLFGLALGVCLAFILDFWDRTLSTPEQVEELLSLPSLGAVPVIEGTAENRRRRLPRKDHESLQLVVKANGHDSESPDARSVKSNGLSPVVSEAFRTVCASILLSDSKPARTILVTSAVPGEGKTMFVAQLGRAFAESGAKTVVLELDLRKPALSKQLGVEPGPGLSLFLAGHMNGSSSPEVHATDIRNLYVVSAGPRPPNPIALLNSGRLETLLEHLLTEYRFVLLDSPPVLTVADARVLSRKVQGVVMVASAHKTPWDLVDRARNHLESAGGNLLGLALNRVRSTTWSYSDYGRYYKDESYYSA